MRIFNSFKVAVFIKQSKSVSIRWNLVSISWKHWNLRGLDYTQSEP